MKGYYLMPHPPIIVPAIGKGRQMEAQATINACDVVAKRIAEHKVQTIILISPHGNVFRDGVAIVSQPEIAGDFGKFGVPEVTMKAKIHTLLSHQIIQGATEAGIATVALNEMSAKLYGLELEMDHGAMVPLHFLGDSPHTALTNELSSNCVGTVPQTIVHITYGMLSSLELYRFGMIVEAAVKQLGIEAVCIASGDLSHRLSDSGPYPYSPYGEQFDKQLMSLLGAGDMRGLLSLSGELVQEAGECGLRSLYILAGAMDGKSVQGEVLSYEAPFGVGYGVVDFHTSEGQSLYETLEQAKVQRHRERMNQGSTFTRLARVSLDYFFRHGEMMPIDEEVWEELWVPSKGVFVSIKIDGELRGCIGTIGPVQETLAQEIVVNGISAATKDPRFSPMSLEELRLATISVDVLEEPEPATEELLDPNNYGVIVSCDHRRGLLLPHLEGIHTVAQQLEIALQKGGISPFENYHIERFKVERYQEEE